MALVRRRSELQAVVFDPVHLQFKPQRFGVMLYLALSPYIKIRGLPKVVVHQSGSYWEF